MVINNSHEKLWAMLAAERKVSTETIQNKIAHHLEYTLGKHKFNTTEEDVYKATSYAVRDVIIDRFNDTQETYRKKNPKRVYYLSLEFLLGRTLTNSMINMGIFDLVDEALKNFGYDINKIEEYEHDAGLGNGGLGRLAACFMDSLSTLELPGFGYGLRYEYGIFNQHIENGLQIEKPDHWLSEGNPWELHRVDVIYNVFFYGHVENKVSPTGRIVAKWFPTESVQAVAYDYPIPGYNTTTTNNLRLWSARSSQEFNFDYFNHGDYLKAVEDKQKSENISKVLYPNDKTEQGKILRLKQQYLMASASLQDIVHRYKRDHKTFDHFHEKATIQLNDTHPSISIPELMRILIDIENLEWDPAWEICTKVFAYTNHTVLPEALETWNVSLIEHLLPRHMQIIYEINHRFIEQAKQIPDLSEEDLSRMSIIMEGGDKKVRMANLAIIGSFSVNGVAALHTELLKSLVFPGFYKISKEKFNNKTNGITHRRFLIKANPRLTSLIHSKIGVDFVHDLNRLKDLEAYAEDREFQDSWQKIKTQNKEVIAKIILDTSGVKVDTNSIFDVQIKRFHEYKRQLLNILHVVGLYTRIQQNPALEIVPRTFIFGGKAAPGYFMAKLIIRFINAVADVVNNDKNVDGRIKVVFLPNYRVSLAEKIFPASDLSEQISTAGTEASGTGNMKFALNGALTVGTLDGANIEMMEEVGEENFYIFGLKTEEVMEWKKNGYHPASEIHKNAELQRVFTLIREGYFANGNRDVFMPIHDNLYYDDVYMLLADYDSYAKVQSRISTDFLNRESWNKKSILNVARMGKFSSDRTILEYARDIWKVEKLHISKPTQLHKIN
ncbi:MAG: glycogen/starch/alpha-glucan phosphorylase [Leptospiraceae bacterium]|nr:glycogen/starch/alpha-glucan phosphorylase [Leptospiraceae bacterium]MCP5511387.1 glycogen/starch/alpha-glucan phosphorylase [Leptospiraceae bacterium]